MMFIRFIIILNLIKAADTASLFQDLPPIVVDDNAIMENPNTHTTVFHPVGKYATDVHYQFIRLPIHFSVILKQQEDLGIFMHNCKNIVRGKATEAPITKIIALANSTLNRIKLRTKTMILNMPTKAISAHEDEKKRFLDLIFGIAGTVLGVSNQIQITKINAIIASEAHRTDMLVDVQQLHENHLHSVDIAINNTSTSITEFVQYSPAVASQALTGMLLHVEDSQRRIEDTIATLQNSHRLSPKMFSNDVLETIKAKIDETALKMGYVSFVNHVTDLSQIPASFVWQPNNLTCAIILHNPFVYPQFLLQMHQYLPFPLSHNLSPNHSLTPVVGQYDILAYSGDETFKLVSQSDLAACHRMGETYFCKGRNDLRTDILETCPGSLFLQQSKGVQKHCKFEINPAREQVFKLSYNKWTVSTQKQYTTHMICSKSRRPIIVGPGAIIELKPGCKVRLQTHILTADNIEEIQINPTYFNWNWNASQIFPAMEPHQFSQAMQALQDFGLHIVDAADIAHHLKFANFSDPTPKSISDLFVNPLHYVNIVVILFMICTVSYIIYTRCCQGAQAKLQTLLPVTFTASAPLATSQPPGYSHNDPNDPRNKLPMFNLH